MFLDSKKLKFGAQNGVSLKEMAEWPGGNALLSAKFQLFVFQKHIFRTNLDLKLSGGIQKCGEVTTNRYGVKQTP